MLFYDHRMIEGSPLRYHYQNQFPSTSTRLETEKELFRPYLHLGVQHNSDYYPIIYEQFSPRTMSHDEDIRVAPNSPQMSDSEGSISSVSIESPTPKLKLKCCWRNCGIDFDTLDQLASHVSKVHGASGPGGLFYCGWEGCTRNERAFNARYKMLVHVRTHTNEKPHQCYQCDKSFSRAENLKIHIRSHSGEKPYVCPVPGCNKAYSNSSDRFKHTRTHQVDKPYHCKVPGCSKRYTDPSSLRKHVKTYKHYVHDTNIAVSVGVDKQPISQHQQINYKVLKDYNCKENEFEWSDIIGKNMFNASYQMDIDIDAPLDLSISSSRKSS